MDISISNWIGKTFGDNKLYVVFWKWVTNLGGVLAIISIIAILLCIKKTRKVGFYMGCSIGLALLTNMFVLKPLIKRPRPFVANPELKRICELAGLILPLGFSMPSSHSAVSMAVAMSVFMHNKKWGGILFLYPFMIGLSRVALCVHYFSDVVVGWIEGAMIAIAVYFILNRIIKLIISKKEKNNGKNSISVSE